MKLTTRINEELVEQEAFDFRHFCYLSPYSPINCKSLLLQLNVQSFYRPLSDNFSGMCLKGGEKRFMLINSNHTIAQQNMTIGHELYHLFVQKEFTPHCGHPYNYKKNDLNELIADTFSSYFLMPEAGLRKIIPGKEIKSRMISLTTLLRLEACFAVPHDALLQRLVELQLLVPLEKERYEELDMRQIAQEYGYDPSLYSPGNKELVISDLSSKLHELLDQGMITEDYYDRLMES